MAFQRTTVARAQLVNHRFAMAGLSSMNGVVDTSVCVYVCGGMSTVCVVHCTVAGRWDQEQYKVVPHGYGIGRMQVVYSRERKCLAAWVASA